jgi:hypothetical protein
MVDTRKNIVTLRLNDLEIAEVAKVSKLIAVKYKFRQARSNKNFSEFSRRCISYGTKHPDLVMGAYDEYATTSEGDIRSSN